MRSRAAAAILDREGFKDVYSMQGGINAWSGLVAKGAPESGMAYFSSSTSPGELIALAWYLEDGSRTFYLELDPPSRAPESKDLYRILANAEEHHRALLEGLFRRISVTASREQFPGSVILPEKETIMEGGIRVDEALKWAKGKQEHEVLEFALSLEANALDLYIKMQRRVADERSSQVFLALAREEKDHLDRLNALFEKSV